MKNGKLLGVLLCLCSSLTLPQQNNNWNIIGLKAGSSPEKIKSRCKELMLKYHPDKCRVSYAEAHNKFIEISDACLALKTGKVPEKQEQQPEGSTNTKTKPRNCEVPSPSGLDTFLESAINAQSWFRVKFFLVLGASPNAVTVLGEPVLIKALFSKNLDIIKLLVQAGADVNVGYGGQGGNAIPLVIAVVNALESGDLDVVKLLLDYGAHTDIKTQYGDSILDYLESLPKQDSKLNKKRNAVINLIKTFCKTKKDSC